MAKVAFDFEQLTKTEKELYISLSPEKKVIFEKKWSEKVTAEKVLRQMQISNKQETRKRVDTNKYKLGGLLMKYTGGKTEWSESELQNLERYLDQYQNAIKSYIQNPRGVVANSELRG